LLEAKVALFTLNLTSVDERFVNLKVNKSVDRKKWFVSSLKEDFVNSLIDSFLEKIRSELKL
jgi:hypothetical protein